MFRHGDRSFQCKFEALERGFNLSRTKKMGLINTVTGKVLQNAVQWTADHSAQLYNQTTGPQLQQIEVYQMPIILSDMTAWLVGLVKTWQVTTALFTASAIVLLILLFVFLCFVWLCKIHSTHRKILDTLQGYSHV